MHLHPDTPNPNPASLLKVVEATLLVSAAADAAADRLELLDATLQRLGVRTAKLRTVTLEEEPQRAAHYGLRFTPCIVLDTGHRFVLLYGPPASLTAADFEAALSRR